jgi:hypothetical protein
MFLPAHISPGGWTIGPLVAAVQRRSLTTLTLSINLSISRKRSMLGRDQFDTWHTGLCLQNFKPCGCTDETNLILIALVISLLTPNTTLSNFSNIDVFLWVFRNAEVHSKLGMECRYVWRKLNEREGGNKLGTRLIIRRDLMLVLLVCEKWNHELVTRLNKCVLLNVQWTPSVWFSYTHGRYFLLTVWKILW